MTPRGGLCLVAAIGLAGADDVRAQPESARAPAEVAASADTVAERDAEHDEADEDAPRRWETPRRAVPRHVVSLPLFTLLNRGFGLTYEHTLPMRFSVSGSLAIAQPAAGDFRSRRSSLTLAGRYYALPRGPFTRFEGDAPVGLFLEARLGMMRTALDDADGNRVGTSSRVSLATAIGYRFTIRGVVELTPSVGTVFYAENDTHLPSMIRPTVAYGLTVGGMFRGRIAPTGMERRADERFVARRAARDAREAQEHQLEPVAP